MGLGLLLTSLGNLEGNDRKLEGQEKCEQQLTVVGVAVSWEYPKQQRRRLSVVWQIGKVQGGNCGQARGWQGLVVEP